MMEVLKFIILTWLASFVPAAYCQMGNFSSEAICNITIFKQDGPYSRAVSNVLQNKMVDRCPENYTNETIITSCEHFNSLKSLDSDLYIPVTDNITNITYVNKYCGYCNNYEYNGTNWEWRWSTWSPTFVYLENQDPCENYTSEIKASEVNDLDKWTQTFLNNGLLTLKITSYSRTLECSGKKNWPIKLLYWEIPCLVQNYKNGQDTRLKSCQYFDENDKSCMKMDFIIEGISFHYGSKSYYHLSQINLTGGDYIVQSGNEDIFYMCKQIYKVGYWGKFALIIASVAFLCAYLIMNLNKRYFENFSNQLLYVYSIGLIIMSVLLTYIYLKFPVSDVSFYLVKIFWTYHFLWTVLIFIVFCNLAFCLCDRCESVTKENINACDSLLAFLFGLVLPVSLTLMYLHFLGTYENQCPLIPGHTAVPVVSRGNLEFMKFVLDTSLSYLMPILFVVGILCSLIDMSCDQVRSATSIRKSPMVLFKMVLIMGIHCILYKLCSGYYGNENTYTVFGLSINMDTVAQFSIDIHGVLVFFIFLTRNTMINDFLIKRGYKRGNTTQQNCNGATETTVQFQS